MWGSRWWKAAWVLSLSHCFLLISHQFHQGCACMTGRPPWNTHSYFHCHPHHHGQIQPVQLHSTWKEWQEPEEGHSKGQKMKSELATHSSLQFLMSIHYDVSIPVWPPASYSTPLCPSFLIYGIGAWQQPRHKDDVRIQDINVLKALWTGSSRD